MIEINPRISTIVYQEDLNLPYLGVKRALGEISDEELRALRAADPARRGRRCATSTRSSGTRVSGHADAVLHPEPPPTHGDEDARGAWPPDWPTGQSSRRAPRRVDDSRCASPTARSTSPASRGRTSQALRRRGRRRAARRLRARQAPPRGRLVARPPRRASRAGSSTQWRALARLLPRTDVFHFYFGLTLVPKSLQFPILRAHAQEVASSTTSARTSAARRPRSSPTASAPTPRSSAPTTRSAGCPRPRSSRPGSTSPRTRPCRRPTAPRPLVVHAPSNRAQQGHRARDRGLRAAARRARDRRGPPPRRGARGATRRADIVVDQLNAGWHGVFAIEAMALGKPVVTFLHDGGGRAQRRRRFGVERADRLRATKRDARRRAAARSSSRAPRERREHRRREPRLRRAGHDIDRDRRPPARHLPLGSAETCRASATQIKRLGQALGDLRPRRARLAAPRRPPAAALHALPRPAGFGQDRDGRRAAAVLVIVLRARDLERVLPLLLRLGGRRAHELLVVRTSFWFTMADGDRRARRRLIAFASQIARLARRSARRHRGSSAPASSGSGRR